MERSYRAILAKISRNPLPGPLVGVTVASFCGVPMP
jgi:hypothetical protein